MQCKVALVEYAKLPNPEMNSNDDQAKLKLPRKNIRKITLAVRNLEPAKHNQMSCSIENQGDIEFLTMLINYIPRRYSSCLVFSSNICQPNQIENSNKPIKTLLKEQMKQVPLYRCH